MAERESTATNTTITYLNVTTKFKVGNVYNLSLRGCKNISDVSALGNVHTLKIVDCDKITDVSALKNVHT